MPDFSQLKKLDITSDKTAKYIFPQIEGKVAVLVLPAAEGNKPYFNALLRRGRKNARQVQAGAVDVNLLANNRDDDRELFSKYIVKGWENVTDASGKAVEFNETNCCEFLTALPNHIMDGLREFCGNILNFTDEVILDDETTSKNS